MFDGKYGGLHVPEDKDQALVTTPFGTGLVVRTRKDEKSGKVIMREIELCDWLKPEASKGPQRPCVLFSPTKFPSVRPQLGSEVLTVYGRGKVVEVRDDKTVVVKLANWRLAGRSLGFFFMRIF